MRHSLALHVSSNIWDYIFSIILSYILCNILTNMLQCLASRQPASDFARISSFSCSICLPIYNIIYFLTEMSIESSADRGRGDLEDLAPCSKASWLFSNQNPVRKEIPKNSKALWEGFRASEGDLCFRKGQLSKEVKEERKSWLPFGGFWKRIKNNRGAEYAA